jgi:hypothetical protein
MFAELQGMMWHWWFHQTLGFGQTVASQESLHNLACRWRDFKLFWLQVKWDASIAWMHILI